VKRTAKRIIAVITTGGCIGPLLFVSFIVVGQSETPRLTNTEIVNMVHAQIFWAIMSGNSLMVQTLIKGGAEVNPRPKEGLLPLMMAVQSLSLPMTNTLLRAGADVNAKSSNGYTALMVAAEDSSPEILRRLIAARAEVNAKNKFGETALMLARKAQHSDAIAILRRAGAR
jgi:ankyrin repeat protein